MFNLKFFKSLKEALDTKANLLTFASSQRKANEEYIESLSSNELKIKADEEVGSNGQTTIKRRISEYRKEFFLRLTG